MKRMIKNILKTTTILKFLLFHEEEYREKVLKRVVPFVGFGFAILALDFWKLTPSGILQPKTQWELRILCMLLLLLLYVLSLIPLTNRNLNKWKNVSRLSSQDLAKLTKYYDKT
jgi:hypothetical protein